MLPVKSPGFLETILFLGTWKNFRIRMLPRVRLFPQSNYPISNNKRILRFWISQGCFLPNRSLSNYHDRPISHKNKKRLRLQTPCSKRGQPALPSAGYRNAPQSPLKQVLSNTSSSGKMHPPPLGSLSFIPNTLSPWFFKCHNSLLAAGVSPQ